MVTIYEKESGKAVNFSHMIDAKESVAGGFYVWENPVAPEEPEVPEVVEKVEEDKPEVSEEAEEKKPVSVPVRKSRTISKKPSRIKK